MSLEDLSESGESQQSPKKTCVTYITENMVRRVTREDTLENITSLNLTPARDGDHKIRVSMFIQ